jgi:asparagine synthase (glutamine-hydrolysing)
MCGIGVIIDGTMNEEEMRSKMTAMQAKLRHRGPDGEGVWVDEVNCVGLCHTRLAIMDLSPAGAQPMHTPDLRYSIVFNGEIYNFLELRDELAAKGVTFRSHSDTEVILESYRCWGSACVERFVGMFAFAIWDRSKRRLFCARGPMGIKPLYFWQHGNAFAVASEIRAILEVDLGPRRLCLRALQGYLLFGSVQDPLTLIEGIESVPAGCTLVWHAGKKTLRRFAHLEFGQCAIDHNDAVAATRLSLEQSVRRHFVSDVPVSIFLSGGIDSTAILALARRCGFDHLQTYCLSFDDAAYNEGDLAARTAKHFGAKHHDWRMTADEGRRLFPQFLAALDQPSNDGFNTFCVAKCAHEQGAKVVLSGLGGDELFGGYPSFRGIPELMRWYRRFSSGGPLRSWAGKVAERFATQSRWQRAGAYLQTPGSLAAAYWTMRGMFTPREAERLIAMYTDADKMTSRLQLGGDDLFGIEPPELATESDAVGYLESTRYMQNQLLRDSDVMSMAWGLELRVPFVDIQLHNDVASIAAEHRLVMGKRLILEAVPEIPSWVADAPKRGFSFPFERWLSGEWRDVVQATDRKCPFRLGSWYRRWSLFTLEHFLRENRVDAAALALS